MKNNISIFGLIFLSLFIFSSAQTLLTDAEFQTWKNQHIDFITFDVRGNSSLDSIVVPAFFIADPTSPINWLDSLGCKKRVLFSCYTGGLASVIANAAIAAGYPVDSVFYSGYNILTSSRYPMSDTLKLSMLNTGKAPFTGMTGNDLRAYSLSKNEFSIIDVRSVSEVSYGSVPGACNLVWSDQLMSSVAQLSHTDYLIFYCASGNRAGQTVTWMQGQGFDSSKLINFGGFGLYENTGNPIAFTLTDNCKCTSKEELLELSSTFADYSVIPNPFNPSTTIFSRNSDTFIKSLEIYSVKGELIKSLSTNNLAGQSQLTWDGENFRGNKLPAGNYFARILNSKGKTTVLRLVLKK